MPDRSANAHPADDDRRDEDDEDLNVQTERPCANCQDECLTLSSRDWCDGCEEEAEAESLLA